MRSRPRRRRPTASSPSSAPVGTEIVPPCSARELDQVGLLEQRARAQHDRPPCPRAGTARRSPAGAAAGAHSTTRSANGSSSSIGIDRGTSSAERSSAASTFARFARADRGELDARDAAGKPRASSRPIAPNPAMATRVTDGRRCRRRLDLRVVVGDRARAWSSQTPGQPDEVLDGGAEPPEPERLADDEAVHGDAADERLLLGLLDHLVEVVDDHLCERVRRSRGGARSSERRSPRAGTAR